MALLTLHIEWFVQQHYVESVKDDQDLDPQFKSLLNHHWLEEAQHTKLDTLIVEEIAAATAPDDIAKAVDEYLEIGAFIDAGMQQQAQLDLASLEHATGRRLTAERYLDAKARKRTVAEDKRQFEHLKTVFGAETPLADVTAARISEYKAKRLSAKSERTGRALTAAAVNRPLALLRHLLRLAHEEWEQLGAVPRIRLEKEPQGRIRWLAPDEESRLLAACEKSQNKELLSIVTVALETGLRKGELLGLTWDRVDLSRGVLRLEVTKSGRRREVPMRQVVYGALAAIPEKEREGLVWRSGSIRTAFERAVTAAKLDAPFHFHDCRHHFASWFVMRGGNIVALQDLLGHASLSMTRRYAHLAPDHLRSEVAKTEKPTAKSVVADVPVATDVTVQSANGTMTSHDVESESRALVSPRKAGVAQRQSN